MNAAVVDLVGAVAVATATATATANARARASASASANATASAAVAFVAPGSAPRRLGRGGCPTDLRLQFPTHS